MGKIKNEKDKSKCNEHGVFDSGLFHDPRIVGSLGKPKYSSKVSDEENHKTPINASKN